MRGRTIMRTIRLRDLDLSRFRGAVIALCFALGALLGHLFAAHCGEETMETLRAYLADYCAVYDAGQAGASMLSCVVLYYGYGAALLVLGFSSAGVALIPLLGGTFGFLSMYTVSCFARTFGRTGVALALGLMGVRLLFTLPCFLALAEMAWPLSTELFLLSFGWGKRSASVQYGSRYFLLFLLCAVILAVGVCCERFLTPVLFRSIAGRVLSIVS